VELEPQPTTHGIGQTDTNAKAVHGHVIFLLLNSREFREDYRSNQKLANGPHIKNVARERLRLSTDLRALKVNAQVLILNGA
jgi:hypothetical protein